MAIVKCKGTKLQHTVSASLVDIAQILSIEHSGSGSETFESTTLDGGVYKTFAPTGYSNPGQVSMELFFDPALVGHQAITDLIASPATNAMKIIYADTGATNQSFTSAGVEFGATVAMDDGLKASVTYTVTGDPGWPT
ncbi:MAG: Lambda phage tail tube protein [Planctomycetota bacterium]|jgi:hypothetical protein